MKEGVLIIGHGSRLSFNKDIVELQAQCLRDKGFKNVYAGFNELSEPTIEDTLEKMVKDGIDTIYALPLFISSGIHLTEDIPEKIGIPINSDGGTAVIAGKKVFIKYATPIGDDPKVTEILAEKIAKMK
ncbi:MAG: sirohydrochlorin cobaltochelatase [Methanomassiliicoccaceae archaeon]|jgi:sirohydrochlorin cobaltochelatase|nr:sirohydrochlorin cobaltochelatase [Methanomassiliicoccaceae archaeon]